MQTKNKGPSFLERGGKSESIEDYLARGGKINRTDRPARGTAPDLTKHDIMVDRIGDSRAPIDGYDDASSDIDKHDRQEGNIADGPSEAYRLPVRE